jgi:hypothetical protein
MLVELPTTAPVAHSEPRNASHRRLSFCVGRLRLCAIDRKSCRIACDVPCSVIVVVTSVDDDHRKLIELEDDDDVDHDHAVVIGNADVHEHNAGDLEVAFDLQVVLGPVSVSTKLGTFSQGP